MSTNRNDYFCPANHPLQERLVTSLTEALAACRELDLLAQGHERECNRERGLCSLCDFLENAQGMAFTIHWFRDGLESHLHPFGQWPSRRAGLALM